MKNNYFAYIGMLALIALILCTGCKKVTKIDDEFSPDSLSARNNEDCTFTLKGTVLNASTCVPIENALIEVLGLEEPHSTFSSSGSPLSSLGEGQFEIEFEISEDELLNLDFREPKIIQVTQEGFVISTLQINFSDYYNPTNCGDIETTVIESEFILTPRRNIPLPITSDGGEFWIKDTIKCIVDNGFELDTLYEVDSVHVSIPENSVGQGEEIDLFFTPIDISQYLGVFDSLTFDSTECIMYRFECLPDGIEFLGEGLTITIPLRREIGPNTQVQHYVRNPQSNEWELQNEAAIALDNGNIQLQLTACSEHMITFAPHLRIDEVNQFTGTINKELAPGCIDGTGSGPGIDDFLFETIEGNCNCLPTSITPSVLTTDIVIEDNVEEILVLEGIVDKIDAILLLNDLRVLYNLPAFTNPSRLDLDFDEANSRTTIRILVDRVIDFTGVGMLNPCERKRYFARGEIIEFCGTAIAGTEEMSFAYQNVIAIDAGEEIAPTEAVGGGGANGCGLESLCHQGGCPELIGTGG